ncbi:MAG: hypothetical protein JRI23_13140 [Deltaproteobacteria bacterium]|nr:hypothetical protein [Deltaproteobacteria bacterium]MBW2532668.1 hypothetical protein [Deltaproteobacteria bacterium]
MGATSEGWATSAIETPGTGVVSAGRGGAWLVRADDPMAAYLNPAALVTQPHGVSAGVQLMIRSHCYDRLDVTGARPSPGGGLEPAPGEVCADIPPFPNPHLAASFRLHKRFALGLAVFGPHATGSAEWPATLTYPEGSFGDTEHPAPQRYLLLEADNIMMFPTLSASFAATKDLSFGAGFVWGIAAIDFKNLTESTSSLRGDPQPDDFTNDIAARVTGLDAFVPGFVLSALWYPQKRIGLAGWFRWSDAVRAPLDMEAHALYYEGSGQVEESPTVTDADDSGSLKMPIPMEAKIGVRYRHPRRGAKSQKWANRHRGWTRDPMSQDLFDVELNLTWANNSAVDVIEVRFDDNIEIAGTPGFAPVNGDIPHEWRDTLGVRLGGDYYVIPDLLALRAGGFFESSASNDEYLNIDFHVAERIGVGGGLTVRLGPVDLSAAYQHTFFGTIDNGGRGLVRGISGDRTTGERTRQPVNGGSSTSSLNEVALGAGVHF